MCLNLSLRQSICFRRFLRRLRLVRPACYVFFSSECDCAVSSVTGFDYHSCIVCKHSFPFRSQNKLRITSLNFRTNFYFIAIPYLFFHIRLLKFYVLFHMLFLHRFCIFLLDSLDYLLSFYIFLAMVLILLLLFLQLLF